MLHLIVLRVDNSIVRIKWDVMLEPEAVADDSRSNEASAMETKDAYDSEAEEEKDDDVDEENVKMNGGRADGTVAATVDEYISHDNRCDLLWRGILPKRSFPGFKFQECKSAVTARKLLEAKGVAHYWDMAYNADEMLEVAKI